MEESGRIEKLIDYLGSPILAAYNHQPRLGTGTKPSKRCAAAMAGILSAGISGLGISFAEHANRETQNYEAPNAHIEQVTYAQPSKTALFIGAINPFAGALVHYDLREPQTRSTISGNFQGPETTTFTPVFREGLEPLVETRTTNVSYTCRTQDDGWDVELSQDLGSFNESITKRLEEHCEEIYQNFTNRN